jgi:hypothetical protein
MTDKELIERRRAAAEQVPACNYRHYKGGMYSVLLVALRESDLQPVVVYASRDEPQLIYTRPLASWLETVAVDGTRVPRFSPV